MEGDDDDVHFALGMMFVFMFYAQSKHMKSTKKGERYGYKR